MSQRVNYDEVAKHRVLKPGGWFALTNSVPFEMTDWPVYQYFPQAYERDCRDYLPTVDLIDLAEGRGFEVLSSRTQAKVTHIPVEKFLEDVRGKTNCSQLILLTEEDFQQGLKKLEQDFKGRTSPVEISIAELALTLKK